MMRRVSGSVDVGLAGATKRIVEQSLGVVPGERVLVVADERHASIADGLAEAVTEAKSQTSSFRLEALGRRPHATLAPAIAAAMSDVQASVLLVDFHAGELDMRAELVELAREHRLRHAHMVGVSRASILAGFSVDPHRIAAQARDLLVRLVPDARISVRTAAGTDLVVTLSPRHRWVEFGCIVGPGKRVNLPGGELVTCPESVDGVYVADATIGDSDGELSRPLRETPLTLHFAGGRVRQVECARDPSLARAVSARMSTGPGLDRVGLVSFGVNIGLSAPVGDIATDQKLPGVHLSLGETLPSDTGAAWTAKGWLGFASVETDADVDKLAVLRRGRYVL